MPTGRDRSVRYLTFGLLCLALAVVAGVTSSWVPLAILVIIGALFVGLGVTGRRRNEG